MGEFALQHLGLQRGSFELHVEHYSPRAVQYTCVADGAAAATGASLGKLNLSLTEAPAEALKTVYRNKANGQTITLRVTEGFRTRFRNVPRPELAAAGGVVAELPPGSIFEVVP